MVRASPCKGSTTTATEKLMRPLTAAPCHPFSLIRHYKPATMGVRAVKKLDLQDAPDCHGRHYAVD